MISARFEVGWTGFFLLGFTEFSPGLGRFRAGVRRQKGSTKRCSISTFLFIVLGVCFFFEFLGAHVNGYRPLFFTVPFWCCCCCCFYLFIFNFFFTAGARTMFSFLAPSVKFYFYFFFVVVWCYRVLLGCSDPDSSGSLRRFRDVLSFLFCFVFCFFLFVFLR